MSDIYSYAKSGATKAQITVEQSAKNPSHVRVSVWHRDGDDGDGNRAVMALDSEQVVDLIAALAAQLRAVSANVDC